MQNSEMAIFISSPDSYADVFEVFLECFNKFWADCPYELVLSTNSKTYPNITVFRNNKLNDGWMERAIPVLKEMNTEYVLLMSDDCIITEKVNTDEIRLLLEDVKKYNINFCGLTNHIRGKECQRNSNMTFVRNNKAYAKNLQTGIFKREYLLTILGGGEKTPWELEEMWLEEASHGNGKYFSDIASCKKDILHCRNGVLKGKWYASVVSEIKRLDVDIPIERKVIGRFEEYRLMTFSKIGKVIPAKYRSKVKKIVASLGCSFASKN